MVNPLSRVAMANLLKDNKPIISQRTYTNDNVGNRVGNRIGNSFGNREEGIIKDIIHGNIDVEANVGKKEIISLDEAANRIKNNR